MARMLGDVLGWGLAALLLGGAGLKLASARRSHAALETFGLRGERLRWVALSALIAAEMGLAAGLALGSDLAAYLGAGLMLFFAAELWTALARGRRGAPCACFGARSRVSPLAVVRNVVLAACLAAVPALSAVDPSTEGWLAAGLAVALLATGALAVALLALAREVGQLRLALPPQSALEVPHEGPEVGSRTALIEEFGRAGGEHLALAVFTSEACHVCRSLEPAVASLGRDPVVSVRVFDEQRDAGAWRALDVPGSPFAVALSLDGTVLAKGTFNSLAQIESVLATAERREHEVARA
jgi:hypothetical protein